MTNHNPTPEERLANIFTPEELAGIAASTEIRDTSAISAALGGIGLGDVAAKELPDEKKENLTKEYEATLEALKILWEDENPSTKAAITQMLGLDEKQIAMSMDEWREHPEETEYLNCNLELASLTSAKGFKLPRYIAGSLNLRGIELSEGLELPEFIQGSLDLAALKSAKDLTVSKYVGGALNMGSLSTINDSVFPRYIGRGLGLMSLESPEGLMLPEHIGSTLLFGSLKSIEGLVLPEHFNGDIYLESLESLENLAKFLGSYEGEVVLPFRLKLDFMRTYPDNPPKWTAMFAI